MSMYAKARLDRLHWYQPTKTPHAVHLFDEEFPAWSICHRMQMFRGYERVAHRPARVCEACEKLYNELLVWVDAKHRT